MKATMAKLVALCKNRGFIFGGSEIYGGLANTWDFAPLGVELKNNIKQAWWRKFVTESEYNLGLDSAILMNPAVWQASGHIGGFSDPLVDCRNCQTRHRADKLIEDYMATACPDQNTNGWDNDRLQSYLVDNQIACPDCGKADFTPIRKFNLMFKTFQGVDEDTASVVYLRPETAQGIFVNFKNIARALRARVPFGVGQIGKSFRNEITPGNFIFRIREFEQMELEFFCKPGTDLEWFGYWKDFCHRWLLDLGLKPENLRLRDHAKEELSHYSNATTDFEYNFPFGWGELWGIADRTDFDLLAHQAHSKQSLEYLDPITNEKYVPYVIEPSLGVERVLLAFLADAYDEEELGEGDTRIVLRLHPVLAPYKVAILPLQKKLGERAGEIYRSLLRKCNVAYDETGSIGKRYRRQDEIGTPYCVTIDFETLEDNCVTVRERDSMQQVRIPIAELESFITSKLVF